MTDAILMTRLDALEASLKQVEDFGQLTSKRRKNYAELDRLTNVYSLRRRMKAAIFSLESNQEDLADHIFERADDPDPAVLDYGLEEIKKQIDNIKRISLEMNQQIDGARAILLDMDKRVIHLDEDLAKSATDAITKAVEDQLDELAAIRSLATSGDGPDSNVRAWEQYVAAFEPDCNKIFRDYVDLLRGLAVRDANLDEGICRIADRFISDRGIEDLDLSLSIPARVESIEEALTRIIRLGFPHWNIFSLPLVAHELGVVIIKDQPELQQAVAEHRARFSYPRDVKEYLADLFAASTMGPAYAAATVHLRLLPYGAQEEIAHRDAGRAYAMFSMLRYVDEHAALDENQYSEIIQELEHIWQASGAATFDEKEPLDELLQATGPFLIRHQYPTVGWTRVEDLCRELIDSDVGDLNLSELSDLRDVLNAIWWARIQAPMDPVKLQLMEQRAREACHKIIGATQAGRSRRLANATEGIRQRR